MTKQVAIIQRYARGFVSPQLRISRGADIRSRHYTQARV